MNIKPYQYTNRKEKIRCAIEAGFFIDESDRYGDFSYFDPQFCAPGEPVIPSLLQGKEIV